MAINMDALAQISEGEPSAKVTVTKAWLAEVHRLLTEAEKVKQRDHIGDRLAGISERLMGMTERRN